MPAASSESPGTQFLSMLHQPTPFKAIQAVQFSGSGGVGAGVGLSVGVLLHESEYQCHPVP